MEYKYPVRVYTVFHSFTHSRQILAQELGLSSCVRESSYKSVTISSMRLGILHLWAENTRNMRL